MKVILSGLIFFLSFLQASLSQTGACLLNEDGHRVCLEYHGDKDILLAMQDLCDQNNQQWKPQCEGKMGCRRFGQNLLSTTYYYGKRPEQVQMICQKIGGLFFQH